MYISVCTVEPSYVKINGRVHIFCVLVLSVYNMEAFEHMISFHTYFILMTNTYVDYYEFTALTRT